MSIGRRGENVSKDDGCPQCSQQEVCNVFSTEKCVYLPTSADSDNPPPLRQMIKDCHESGLPYKHLFEIAPDAIFLADAETGIILRANQKAAELLGIPVNEIIGMHQTQLHPPEEARRYAEIFRKHIQAKKDIPIEEDVYLYRRDGKKIPIQIMACIIQFGEKEVIFGIFRDVSSQKQLLEKYKNSQERFKRLAEAAFEAIVIHNRGKIIDANQQYLDMFGYTLDEARTISLIQLIAPQSRDLVEEKIAAKYEGIYESFSIKKDGTIFPVEIQAKESIMDGVPVRIGAIRDLTRQKQQEEQLKAVFESSADCILVWDKDYNYLYANQAAIDHVNTTRDKVIGKNIHDGLGHIPDFMHLWMSRVDEVFKTGQPLRVEDTVPVGDRLVYSESVLSPIRYPGGEMFAVGVVYRDMTEHMQKAQELKAVYESSQDCIIVFDRDYNHLYMNQAAKDFAITISGHEATGNMLDSLPYVPEFLSTWKDRIANVFKTCKPMQFEDAFSIGNRAFYSNSELSPIRYPGGEMFAVSLVFRDVTEQRQLQQQLAESEKRYRRLYKNALVALYRTRIGDGRLLDCSRTTANLFGYADEQHYLEHCSTKSYVNPQDRNRLLEALNANKRIKGFEVQLKRQDGTPFWAAITAEIFPEEDYIEGVMYDITLNKVLSKVERNILNIIMQGKSNKEIAKILGRSIRTIEDHRAHIMQKLGAANLVELTQKALNLMNQSS